MTITDLNQRFAISGHVAFKEGPGGLVVAEIANTLAESTIALQGAHVMTFQPRGQEPVIWLSKFAKFAPGKSIRGGVPVCWPWFGPHASEAALPGHGFARTVMWEVLKTQALADGATFIRFGLVENDATRAQWPHASSAELEVDGRRSARRSSWSRTTAATRPSCSGEALHTYFQISDVAKMKITGLEGCDYLDKVGAADAQDPAAAPITFESEVDRVYLDTSNRPADRRQRPQRRIRIASRRPLRRGMEAVGRESRQDGRFRPGRPSRHGVRGNRQRGRQRGHGETRRGTPHGGDIQRRSLGLTRRAHEKMADGSCRPDVERLAQRGRPG